VSGQEREERHAQAAQGGCGAECELVDENCLGREPRDDAAKPLGDGLRLPQEVVPASLGLVSQGRDHSLARRSEERVDLGTCAGRPYARVAAGSEGELDVLMSPGCDEWSKRGACRDHDPVSARAKSTGDR
jgi:hypothetical protein